MKAFFREYWLAFLFEAVGGIVMLIGLHTYWPFGDEQRHWNNFDVVVHGSFWYIAFYFGLWVSRTETS